jgi:PST family polysaccharide transporter
MWAFSASRGLESVLLYIDQQAPRIILGRVAGAAELGQFVFARRIVENALMVLHQPIRSAALPMFSRIQTEPERVRRAYAEGVALSTSIIFPACAGLAMVAPVVIPLLAGPNWGAAVALLQLLVWGSFRQSFHIWNAALLRGLGKPQLLLWASLWRTVATLALVWLLLPYGAIGVCAALLAGAVLSWPVAMGFVRAVTGIGPLEQLRPGARPFVAMAVMIAALAAARPLAAPWLPVAAAAALIGLGIAVYFGSLALAGREEFGRLLAVARRVSRMRPGGGASTGADDGG